MSNPNYTLDIISHHPTFKNKSLRKYYVDGIETVGAFGDEPFEIKFTNHTSNQVQVKLSLDGTDILTGQLASTDAVGEMWSVNGYGTLTLKAWPETRNGGAQFIFTSANNSVAVNTHGNLSCRGIIAAAVYVEGKVADFLPFILNNYHYTYPYPYPITTSPIVYDKSFEITWTGDTLGRTSAGSGITFNTRNSIDGGNFNNNTSEAVCFNDIGDVGINTNVSKSLESLVSVGAGQHMDQQINYVPGLIKPVFSESVRVRYLWWDDLVSKLRSHNVAAPHASGFPGDAKQNIINLGNTPRLGKSAKTETVPMQSYLRV